MKSVLYVISKRSRYMWIHLRSKDQLNKLKERLLIISLLHIINSLSSSSLLISVEHIVDNLLWLFKFLLLRWFLEFLIERRKKNSVLARHFFKVKLFDEWCLLSDLFAYKYVLKMMFKFTWNSKNELKRSKIKCDL